MSQREKRIERLDSLIYDVISDDELSTEVAQHVYDNEYRPLNFVEAALSRMLVEHRKTNAVSCTCGQTFPLDPDNIADAGTAIWRRHVINETLEVLRG